ncbi:hypothetical protein ACPPVO_37315 [Dactylosporangium sp. McL0621]|uniref:hypothetical protein n=1 Tax=Dactylosporangium sp. McL0621 TaxID=3415678 RepID=UPI003CF364F6
MTNSRRLRPERRRLHGCHHHHHEPDAVEIRNPGTVGLDVLPAAAGRPYVY